MILYNIFLIANTVQVVNSRTISNVITQCTGFNDCIHGFEEFSTLFEVCNNATGICNCSLSNCFLYNSQTNRCDLKPCHAFEELDDGKVLCFNHGGKSKRFALFLNLIAFTGATNFYLGNHVYGSLQLALCLACIALIVCRIVACCNLCCLICGRTVSSITEKLIVCHCCKCSIKCCHVSFTIADVLSLLITAAEIAWMIVDYIEIGLNEKIDGNGCALNDDTINLIQGIVLEVAKGL